MGSQRSGTVLSIGRFSPAFMARQLGHGVKMFFEVYSKWIDGKGDDTELAKIQAAIGTTIIQTLSRTTT